MYPGLQISVRARDELDSFKTYLVHMEEIISTRNAEIQNLIEEDISRLSQPEYDTLVRESWNPEYSDYAIIFPKFLYEGFFLSCWSWFESYIHRTCLYLEKDSKILLEWDELKLSVLTRAKRYFKKVGFKIAIHDKSWNEISYYAQIRNTILHAGGIYRDDSNKRKSFIDYLANKKIIPEKLSLVEIAMIRHYKGEKEVFKRQLEEKKKLPVHISLTKSFCNEVIETSQEFFKKLGDEYEKLANLHIS